MLFVRSVPLRITRLDRFDPLGLLSELICDNCLRLGIQSSKEFGREPEAAVGFHTARPGLQQVSNVQQVVSAAGQVARIAVQAVCLHESLQGTTGHSQPSQSDPHVRFDCRPC